MSGPGKNASGHSVFVPVLLLAGSLLLMTGFQSMQLMREGETLQQRLAQQKTALEEAGKVRKQLEAVAQGTALLAREGNGNARQLLAQLRKAGITVNPDAAPSGTPSSPLNKGKE